MKTRKYGSFLYRFALCSAVWSIFLCLFYLLAGFKATSDGGLRSLFVEWLCGMEMYWRLLSPPLIGQHPIALALALVGPPLTSAWASPLFPTGHAPDKREIDIVTGSHDLGAATTLLFHRVIEWVRRCFPPVPDAWGSYGPFILWCLVDFFDLFELWRPPYYDKMGLSVRSAVWMGAIWSAFLVLLPRVVRRILDWQAARREPLDPGHREG